VTGGTARDYGWARKTRTEAIDMPDILWIVLIVGIVAFFFSQTMKT
jgi:hypothetical protein